jgi:hypothetical protein
MRGTMMAARWRPWWRPRCGMQHRERASNPLASRSTTVEYVPGIRHQDRGPALPVAKAATEGINRNVKDATVATPVPASRRPTCPATSRSPIRPAPAGFAGGQGPSCDGAAWTAKATPRVRGTEDMNLVACLFPYKSGYHLDMYAVFTKPEGGIMQWPRRLTGVVLGTPEKFTESTMMDVVRAIRETPAPTSRWSKRNRTWPVRHGWSRARTPRRVQAPLRVRAAVASTSWQRHQPHAGALARHQHGRRPVAVRRARPSRIRCRNKRRSSAEAAAAAASSARAAAEPGRIGSGSPALRKPLRR